MKKYIIGVDLGGTKIAAAAADLKGKIMCKLYAPTEAHLGKNASVNNIIGAIYKVMDKVKAGKKSIKKIGICAPGPIISKTGEVVNPPNLPGWRKLPLRKILENEFGTKVILENDANTAAFGESVFGAGKNFRDIVYLTISTGIGGGIIIDKKIYRGSRGSAGEIGHTVIDLAGPKCSCGGIGHLEALASGPAIARAAKLPDGETVLKEALAGNKTAIESIENAGRYIGLAIANLLNIINPEIVIIGGGVSKMGSILFNPIRKTSKELAIPLASKNVKIVRAKLGLDAGLIGAIALCL